MTTTVNIKLFSKHLSAGEQMNELMFGLIMTLTFTLTAGFVIGDDISVVRELLVATIGCNIAWGIIDGGLLVLGRAFDRSRLTRLGDAIRALPDNKTAGKVVADELDPILADILSTEQRQTVYTQITERVRNAEEGLPTGIVRDDWWAAHAVFWLVVFASFPAAAPFLFIDEPWLAIRISNAILLVLFFAIGFYWGGFTHVNRWRAAIMISLFGVVMVLMAVALGG